MARTGNSAAEVQPVFFRGKTRPSTSMPFHFLYREATFLPQTLAILIFRAMVGLSPPFFFPAVFGWVSHKKVKGSPPTHTCAIFIV